MNRYQKIAQLSLRLESIGLSDFRDHNTLRLIEKTLHRWGERECNGEVERDEETGKVYAVYGHNGPGPTRRYQTADKETGALRRLAKVMQKYPRLWFYHQGDPRGCALYVGKKSDMRRFKKPGYTLDSVYSSIGVAVCV